MIAEIPRVDPTLKERLFYSKQDILTFSLMVEQEKILRAMLRTLDEMRDRQQVLRTEYGGNDDGDEQYHGMDDCPVHLIPDTVTHDNDDNPLNIISLNYFHF